MRSHGDITAGRGSTEHETAIALDIDRTGVGGDVRRPAIAVEPDVSVLGADTDRHVIGDVYAVARATRANHHLRAARGDLKDPPAQGAPLARAMSKDGAIGAEIDTPVWLPPTIATSPDCTCSSIPPSEAGRCEETVRVSVLESHRAPSTAPAISSVVAEPTNTRPHGVMRRRPNAGRRCSRAPGTSSALTAYASASQPSAQM